MSKAIAKKTKESELAFALFQKVIEAQSEAGKQFLIIGESLTIINEKKLYKFFEAENFEQFLAIPEVGMARATARLCMHVYDLYIRRLGRAKDEIADVPISRLQRIAPVVEKNPDEWLAMAGTLSPSDLDSEVRKEQGLPPRKIPKKEQVHELTKDYLVYAKSVGCAACGRGDSIDQHHFPRTRGAGGDDSKVIPLCRICHTAYHADPNGFLVENKEKIFDYFYEAIFKACAILAGGDI